jgi:phospholipase C
LRLLEDFTGVREANITDWRRSTFASLSAALRLKQAPGQAPTLPDTTGLLKLAQYEAKSLPRVTLPGADQKMPQQEKKRPAKS